MNLIPRTRRTAIGAHRLHPARGITVIELLITIVVIFFLAMLLMPSTRDRGRSHPLTGCGSHLKQVALAFLVWCNDQETALFPARVPVAEGGLLHHPGASDLTVQFAHLSNELISPNVLACPADRQVRIANSFGAASTAREAGLLHPTFRNNAISYALNVDIGIASNGLGLPIELTGNQILLADRNLGPAQAQPTACSCGITNALRIAVEKGQIPGFAPNQACGHGSIGNVALGDGSVNGAASSDLVSLLQPADHPTNVHFMYPRHPAFAR